MAISCGMDLESLDLDDRSLDFSLRSRVLERSESLVFLLTESRRSRELLKLLRSRDEAVLPGEAELFVGPLKTKQKTIIIPHNQQVARKKIAFP